VAAEVTGGFFAHSLALLSDAGHALTDIFALGLAWFATAQAERPANARKTFGYHRVGILAALVNAITLILVTIWILYGAVQRFQHPEPIQPLFSAWSFFTQTRPESSWWGVGLAVAAAIIMPLLWQGKLRIAKRIGSSALKADAACSVTCAYMSLTLLVGLLLNRFFGWWWADPLAALGLVYFLIQEGREALHEARTGETCSCGNEERCGD
jgi:cation diffusion facilitator family transporter